jgi:hypothetical protein
MSLWLPSTNRERACERQPCAVISRDFGPPWLRHVSIAEVHLSDQRHIVTGTLDALHRNVNASAMPASKAPGKAVTCPDTDDHPRAMTPIVQALCTIISHHVPALTRNRTSKNVSQAVGIVALEA